MRRSRILKLINVILDATDGATTARAIQKKEGATGATTKIDSSGRSAI